MFFQHELTEGLERFLLTRINQCLDILCLVLFDEFHGYQSEFVLQMVHHKTRHTTVSINPRMDGHQLIVGIETQQILFNHVVTLQQRASTLIKLQTELF